MCYHTIEAGCQKALVLQRWGVDRIDRACVDVGTSRLSVAQSKVYLQCRDITSKVWSKFNARYNLEYGLLV